jgi:hypothetical protein
MSVLTYPTCPVDCDDSIQPVLSNECAPEWHWGEISKLYIGRADSASFANVDIITEWTARLDDSGVAIDDIRTLPGIGELPEPEQTETEMSGDRTWYSPFRFNLLFDVDETNDTNYEFLLAANCNIKIKFWFETHDGMLYGGNDGIEATMKVTQPIPKGKRDAVLIKLSLKWDSQFWPLRCLSPMA